MTVTLPIITVCLTDESLSAAGRSVDRRRSDGSVRLYRRFTTPSTYLHDNTALVMGSLLFQRSKQFEPIISMHRESHVRIGLPTAADIEFMSIH